MKKSFLKLFTVLFTVALAGVAIAVSISRCVTVESRDEYGNEYYNDYFVELRRDPHYRIVYDKNTKVKYCIIRKSDYESGITPLYNADGSLQIYKGDE